MEKLNKGTIVRYKDGWKEIRACFKDTVNLGPIFHSRTTLKKIPRSEVYPDHDAWYESWTKSETYQCM